MKNINILIITGLSGSGKSTALAAPSAVGSAVFGPASGPEVPVVVNDIKVEVGGEEVAAVITSHQRTERKLRGAISSYSDANEGEFGRLGN